MLKQFTSFVAVASVSAFLAVSLSGCEEKKEEKAQEAAPKKVASAPAPTQSTLEKIKSRGHLQCGINTGLAGFAYTNDKGAWEGFDVAYCRALAAAVLGDPDKVKYTNLTGKTRFPALQSGEIDVLSRNTTWTFSRDVDLGFTFIGVSYYDGQGFIGRKKLGVKSAKELKGVSICIQTGTTTEMNLADFDRANNLGYKPVPIETNAEAQEAYLADRCDVYTTDASGLAATMSGFKDADKHMVFPEIISKEPLGPVVRQGDDQWADIGRWTLNALIVAEELGITKANVAEMANTTKNAEIKRLLGKEGNFGEKLGLDSNWAVRAIDAGGNYAEIFEKYLGVNTPLGLARGLNALYNNGGILYAPPVR